MPHVKAHEEQIKVKTYLEPFAKDVEIVAKLDYKKLCKNIAIGAGLYNKYTFKNGDIFVNKATKQQQEYVKGYLDSIIFFDENLMK